MTEPIELFVVEDQPPILKGLLKSFSAHPTRVRVVGTAMAGDAAVRDIPAMQPQVVLLDLELPGLGGVEVCAAIKRQCPSIEILIFTTFEDENRVFESISAGASGYLVKRCPFEKVLAGVEEVHAGGTVIEAAIGKRFWNVFQAARASPPQPTDPWGLTPQERQVLQFVAKGLSNAEVGDVMEIEKRTVKTHLSHIYRKMGVATHVEAVLAALKVGMIEL